MTDDQVPERVTLKTTANNPDGAVLIKKIYIFLTGYSIFFIISAITVAYVAGKGSVLTSIIFMLFIIDRADKFKLGRIKNVNFELILFILMPILILLILSVEPSNSPVLYPSVMVMFLPFLIASAWGGKLFMESRENKNLKNELSSRSELFTEYQDWLRK